jgi:hypothetical protein
MRCSLTFFDPLGQVFIFLLGNIMVSEGGIIMKKKRVIVGDEIFVPEEEMERIDEVFTKIKTEADMKKCIEQAFKDGDRAVLAVAQLMATEKKERLEHLFKELDHTIEITQTYLGLLDVDPVKGDLH